jgi:cytidylate kinase
VTGVDVVGFVKSRPGPLVTVDGYSGAGKTSFAAELGTALDAPVLSMEELYTGWAGLAAAVARWRPWDWLRNVRSEAWREQAPAPFVVLEGCGAGAAALRPFTGTAIWLDCPPDERDRRLRAREDWTGYARYREIWIAQEQGLLSSAGADLVLPA